MKDNDPYNFTWDVSPAFMGDSLVAPAGNIYRVTAVNRKTGCVSDTAIEIPGFQSISAGFIANIPNGEKCLSNLYPTLRLFNQCIGAETGIWTWDDGTTEPFDPATNPKHLYNGDKDKYHIRLKVFNSGGCTDSADAWVCYRDTIVYFVPTAFSPNGDGLNDVFDVSANGMREFELSIFNRWGEVMFRTNQIGKGWDGTYGGKPCMEGMYAWRIKYKGRKTAWRQDKGNILLMRDK
jgi:gliding motility-associated-like protein